MMESNNHEEYLSEGETDQAIDSHTDIRRSYECVFCKRGFTTAQALGGHMNIHRKDRAKNRPSSSNSVSIPSLSSKVVNDDEGTLRSSYHPIQSFQSHHHYNSIPTHEISWGLRSSHTYVHSDDGNSFVQYPHQYLNPSGGDPCRSVSLHIGTAGVYDNGSKRGEDELDLELRLGQDP